MSTAQNLEAPRVPPPPPPVTRGRKRAFVIFFLVLLLGAAGGVAYWLYSRGFESTDDAQIEMHLDPISARVDGTITKVHVENNQFVHAGDPLVDLDPRDFQVAVNQASAAVGQAASQVSARQPNIPITQVENTANISTSEAAVTTAQAAVAAAEHDRDAASARLTEAEANNTKAQADLARYKILIANEEVSRQEYDQVEAAAKAQAANVRAARSSLESAARIVDQRKGQVEEARSRLTQYRQNAPHQVAVSQAGVKTQQANERSAKAQLEQAQLRLSYTRIVAPVDGVVMKRIAELGAHVAAGQQLLTIAQTGDLWITANFKETQLKRIQPGLAARIHVDAIDRDFEAVVENIAAGTGAINSVLPPENATGNYVKVVQRIPVRLRFKPNQEGLDRLRAGMSVETDVRIAR
jgi:membrane fusion protein (multidrug efflux system)